MKRYSLIINPFAETDLKIAADWYYLQKEGLDQEFIEEIEKTIQRILENPLQFPYVRKHIRMAIAQRFPYGLYFYVSDDFINVFAVFHFSRNPEVLRKRLMPATKKK
jgi:toxin ParE1/3/4